jgi:hypothetical protein
MLKNELEIKEDKLADQKIVSKTVIMTSVMMSYISG